MALRVSSKVSVPRTVLISDEVKNQPRFKYILPFCVFCLIAATGYYIMGIQTDKSNEGSSYSEIVSNNPSSYLRRTEKSAWIPRIGFRNYTTEGITLWSSDFHISPIADAKNILKDFHVNVIDKSLSGHCHLTNTCERDLRVITKLNGIHLTPCPNKIRREFYDSYRLDPVMQSVDAFICTHAASMCELFMPFNKPMIVIASTR